MKPKLKHLRVAAGMTQSNVAEATGVSQPNYQRWEAGAAPIPDDKLKKLAKVLKSSPEVILGRHPPIEAHLYDNSVSEDLSYYGEVSIYFRGGGAPLLLSISDGGFRRLSSKLQDNAAFASVESLANQTVIIRTDAVSDLYFSSEAYDYCGPDGAVFHDYPDHVGIQMPDARDWEIVEALATDGDVDDFDPSDVQRVTSRVMITDEQYAELVADGQIKPEDLEEEKKKNQKETDRIFALSTTAIYRLSSGQQRSMFVYDPEVFYKAFYEVTDLGGGDLEDAMIYLPEEGWHRTVFVNKNALDYVIIPTHKYIEGRVDVDSEELDELEAIAKPARKKAKSQTNGH